MVNTHSEPARRATVSTVPRGLLGMVALMMLVEGYIAPPPRQPATGSRPDLLEFLEALKPLVVSLGVEKVKRLAELLG